MKNRNKLEEIRAKIKVFDKDQTVKSRRMKMKKLAAGGLNTLVKDASVILDVVSLVKEGIASSRSSDSSSPLLPTHPRVSTTHSLTHAE